MDLYTNELLVNLATIRERMAKACRSAGRAQEDVRLLLATKTVPAEIIALAVAAGETLIGENKVQELKAKDLQLGPLLVERHFIGHLQTNKIKEVLQYVNCIQSVDRLDLAEKIHQRLEKEDRSLEIMIQVNTSFELSKFGTQPQVALALLQQVQQLPRLKIKGLMTIGLFDADPEKVRPSFRLLRQLREEAMQKGILLADQMELSMGMSGDLETAIEEGATMVRVGTAVFGKRQYADSYYWNETSN